MAVFFSTDVICSQMQNEIGELPVSIASPKMADVCGQVLLGSGLTVLSHPLMYIKVLIQVRRESLDRFCYVSFPGLIQTLCTYRCKYCNSR